MSPKRSPTPRKEPSRTTRKTPAAPSLSPPVARAGGAVLRSEAVGALPIVNDLPGRIRLEEFLRDALPKEDGRTKLSPARALLVLLRSLLVSREPIYGLGEWAVRYAPDLLSLSEKEIGLLNDDRVGRALDKLFAADVASLVLRVAAHVVKEFGLRLDELHNDSTTISVFGAYLNGALEQRMAEQDAMARAARIERALKELASLRDKLRSPRNRFRDRAKVATAVAEILASCGAEHWIVTEIEEQEVETFRQARHGRPTDETPYVREVTTRFDLTYCIDHSRTAEDAKSDGVFPLITNVTDLSELELLKIYKRQPTIEKSFSQLKTDFEVAPVYLKAVHRIQALLAVYFFALLVEALLERQLRQAMQRQEIESLPLYPEGRACSWPNWPAGSTCSIGSEWTAAESEVGMQRHSVGIIALVLLSSALALWLWKSGAGYDALLGALVRVGLVMGTLWQAWPDVKRLPAWSFAAVPILLLVIAVKPKWFLILLPILLALAALRPRTKATDRNGRR